MPKRQRPAVDSAELKSAAKRARYEAPLERNCFSVPQGEPPPGCKYYLRSFERKNPVNYYQSVLTNSNNSNTSLAAAVDALKRNAHSYSINGLSGRCSTTSTASSRKRKLETLRNDCNAMVMTRQRRQRQEQRLLQQKAPPKQDVSLASD